MYGLKLCNSEARMFKVMFSSHSMYHLWYPF
nr:MAG TPA: hypothetical protein [Caudoviricetes sp.]